MPIARSISVSAAYRSGIWRSISANIAWTATDEDAAVPIVAAVTQKLLGVAAVGLFQKALHGEDRQVMFGALRGNCQVAQRPTLDVSVARVGKRWLNAQCHQVAGTRHALHALQRGLKLLLLGDDMVGGGSCRRAAWVAPAQVHARQPNSAAVYVRSARPIWLTGISGGLYRCEFRIGITGRGNLFSAGMSVPRQSTVA